MISAGLSTDTKNLWICRPDKPIEGSATCAPLQKNTRWRGVGESWRFLPPSRDPPLFYNTLHDHALAQIHNYRTLHNHNGKNQETSLSDFNIRRACDRRCSSIFNKLNSLTLLAGDCEVFLFVKLPGNKQRARVFLASDQFSHTVEALVTLPVPAYNNGVFLDTDS